MTPDSHAGPVPILPGIPPNKSSKTHQSGQGFSDEILQENTQYIRKFQDIPNGAYPITSEISSFQNLQN